MIPQHVSVQMLFEQWQAAEVGVCVLRGYERLPEVGNDLDVMIEPTQRQSFRRVIHDFACVAGLWPVRFANHHHVLLMRFLGLDAAGGLQKLFVDEHSRGAGWWGAQYLTTREVMAGARRHGPWLVPRPAHEAAMMLLGHLLIGGSVKLKHLPRVADLLGEDEREFRRLVERAFGPGRGPRVVDAARRQDADALVRMAEELRRRHIARSLVGRPLFSTRWAGSETAAQLRLKAGRQGLVIQLSGEDPVSFARSVAQGVGPLFKGVWFLGEDFHQTRLDREAEGWQVVSRGRHRIPVGIARERLVVLTAWDPVAGLMGVPRVSLSTQQDLPTALGATIGFLAGRLGSSRATSSISPG